MTTSSDRHISYSEAIKEATEQAFELDPSVCLIGQGVRGAGHIFGTVEGLFEKYGERRVIEMPLSENAVLGFCMGAALKGLRPIFILQRADFLFLSLDQLLNHVSKWHYMFSAKAKVPLVVRCIVGKGWGQGPQHSQSLHSMCSHFPGLRVVFPSGASDAKGLLLNSVFSDDPVVFFEARPSHLEKEAVPSRPYVYPFGKAKIMSAGKDISVVTVSYLKNMVLGAAQQLKPKISLEIIDLISINPIDYKTILASVEKTKRLLILDLSWKTAGISSTIANEISYKMFGKLKAPVEIITIPDYPTPTAEHLEKSYYPTIGQIHDACLKLIK